MQVLTVKDRKVALHHYAGPNFIDVAVNGGPRQSSEP